MFEVMWLAAHGALYVTHPKKFICTVFKCNFNNKTGLFFFTKIKYLFLFLFLISSSDYYNLVLIFVFKMTMMSPSVAPPGWAQETFPLFPLWVTLSTPTHATPLWIWFVSWYQSHYKTWIGTFQRKQSCSLKRNQSEVNLNSVELKPVACPLSVIDVYSADKPLAEFTQRLNLSLCVAVLLYIYILSLRGNIIPFTPLHLFPNLITFQINRQFKLWLSQSAHRRYRMIVAGSLLPWPGSRSPPLGKRCLWLRLRA